MKNILLCACAALCCAVSPHLSAQTSGFSFGLRGGANITTVTGDDAALSLSKFLPLDQLGQFGAFDFTAEPQSATFFSGGVFAAYAFSPLFSLQLEALYSGKGVTYDQDFFYSLGFFGSVSGNFQAEATLTYLEIPLLAKVTLPVGGNVQPYVLAGPTIGILVDKTTSVQGRGTVTITGQGSQQIGGPIPATFAFNDLDFGATVGAGVGFSMMGTAIGAEVRYTLGFQSAVDSVSVEDSELGQGQSTELDIHNRALSISAFMQFYF